MRLCPGSPASRGDTSADGGSEGGMRDGGKSDKEAGGCLTVKYKNGESVKGSQMKSRRIEQSQLPKSAAEQSKNKTSYKRPCADDDLLSCSILSDHSGKGSTLNVT